MTSTCSSLRKSAAGLIDMLRNRPGPLRSIALTEPTSRPRGNTPSSPEVTTVSPTLMSSVRSTYFMITPSSATPDTIPRARERCTNASIAQL